MIEKHLSFSEVHDIYGIRVVVKDSPTCYLALGALHGLYKPVPGKFKDYIAIPKANGYQSLHTALIGPYGVPVEVQIRTDEMHRLAEAGVASHWMYKSDADSLSELQKKTHQWLQSLLEIQSQSGDSQEFLEHVKVDLFPDEVYVFTPKGRILSLPRGATGGGFRLRRAHRHRQQVRARQGERRARAAAHRAAQRRPRSRSSPPATPSRTRPGCSYVRTGKARSNIRHFLKTMQYDESAGARRTPAGTGAQGIRQGVRGDRCRQLGACRTGLRRPFRGRKCSQTSASAGACRRWWRGACCAS
jgi:GTP pyrophosphokinase